MYPKDFLLEKTSVSTFVEESRLQAFQLVCKKTFYPNSMTLYAGEKRDLKVLTIQQDQERLRSYQAKQVTSVFRTEKCHIK